MSQDGWEIFSGRLGRKPDLRYTGKREPVCYLSVAVGGCEGIKPVWKRIVIWGRQAELASVYLNKGSEVFVRGRIVNKEYQDKEGNTKQYNEIRANLIGFTNL